MGRAGARLPGFCLSKIATRVQMRSPPIESKPASQPSQPPESSGNEEKDSSGKKAEQGAAVGYVRRRVMVAVDSSAESKGALQWALSHALQSSDTVVLLDVAKPSKYGDQIDKERNPKDYELLNALKTICQAKRPEVLYLLTASSSIFTLVLEVADDVDRKPDGQRSRGLLRAECYMHGSGCEEKEQERWWIFDHHEAPQRFLALGLKLKSKHETGPT